MPLCCHNLTLTVPTVLIAILPLLTSNLKNLPWDKCEPKKKLISIVRFTQYKIISKASFTLAYSKQTTMDNLPGYDWLRHQRMINITLSGYMSQWWAARYRKYPKSGDVWNQVLQCCFLHSPSVFTDFIKRILRIFHILNKSWKIGL